MKTDHIDMTTRRTFLQACAMGIVTARRGFAALTTIDPETSASTASLQPILRLEMDSKRPLIPVLSWDTERGDRVQTNLLRSPGLRLRMHIGSEWVEGTDASPRVESLPSGTRYSFDFPGKNALQWEISTSSDHFTMTLAAARAGALLPGELELIFPFDPGVTPSTVLPSRWNEDGSFEAPLVISAPDFGQMLLEVAPKGAAVGLLQGDRDLRTTDVILKLPRLEQNQTYTLNFTPVTLAPPQGVPDNGMWRLARRAWFNTFQPCAPWGNISDHNQGGVSGVLSNNVISDPCSLSLAFYADLMLWMPEVMNGISVAQLVRQTIEFWLEKRTLLSGEIIGYTDFVNFLDTNPSILVASWDYVEATGDLAWLKRRIGDLEDTADWTMFRDQDADGLVEATQSGNAGTLWMNNRSCNWFDATNYGHKDAYTNALVYRSLRCLADLEARLQREEKRVHYTRLAEHLKAAFARELLNPETGWIACWKSEDGKLHDYASPIVNSMAVEYGLVQQNQGQQLIDKIWAKLHAVGFTRQDLGIPITLEPVRRSDYLQPDSIGVPTREDGSDSFQQYQNGGISAGHTLHFLAANYLVGYNDRADKMLWAMLGRAKAGGFQNGVQNKGEWTTWDGKPCGYEGYLADVYFFLQAVVLRETTLRKRYYKPLYAI